VIDFLSSYYLLFQTLPERYDFFLISQSVRQGTVNPTSYNVVEDNSTLKPEHLQQLTYKLTHLYYNWPGVVSGVFFHFCGKMGLNIYFRNVKTI
jgi:hypothetical protein